MSSAPANALVFFDDHQAGTRRLREARAAGFAHVMFDDNYLPGKVCAESTDSCDVLSIGMLRRHRSA